MAKKAPRKTPLIERLTWRSVLHQAFAEVTKRANSDSHGPDGMTVDFFRRNAKGEIARLRREIKDGTYAHSPGRGVAIAKNARLRPTPENVRPITVFNVRDRIVQRAISNLIWPHLRDHVFSEVSFGGIRAYKVGRDQTKVSLSPKKNVEAAASKILRLKREGYCFTFETDIQRFFPSIDKNALLLRLEEALPDHTLLGLLEAAISTSVTNADAIEARGLSECWDPTVGVPQGGVLSPLLANFYLAPFDAAMKNAGFQLVRYVDDLVVPATSRADAEKAHALCKSSLAEMGLTIHVLGEKNEKGKIKTRILDKNESFDFLGLRFNKESVHPALNKLEDLKGRIREITHAYRGARTLVDAVSQLNRLLRGWMSAYSFCDTPKGVLTQIDQLARTGLGSWMQCHRQIRNPNSLDLKTQRKIGLWTVTEAEIQPLSRRFFETQQI